ncbi:hypothetical protein PLESTB_000688200 [Pleodorina starrii]|uniref:phytol kinase n=1 Tax=Pleodorina starrii TaxID=330485 RepID=A0A9W6F222_9CHLO|nr:hypothetical protein PLESTM_001229000 [Pleodorina starrii]GLC52920.1 hypothetical protein PLESTB_000688200 [Pleodorina starrii]GLC65215.1 hypothetical protein PLESTF_000264400 [Pleodorina starrii]
MDQSSNLRHLFSTGPGPDDILKRLQAGLEDVLGDSAVLRSLESLTKQAVSTEGQLSDADWFLLTRDLKEVTDCLLTNTLRIFGALQHSHTFCTTLARLISVAIRLSSVALEDPGAPRRKFVDMALLSLRNLLSTVSSASPRQASPKNIIDHACANAAAGALVKVVIGLLRAQLLQCASKRLSEAVQHMRRALGPAATAAAASTGPAPLPPDQPPPNSASSVAVIRYAALLIETMCQLILLVPALGHDISTWRQFLHCLATGLRDSAFLEHASQALVTSAMLMKVPSVEAAAGHRKADIGNEVTFTLGRVGTMFSNLRLQHDAGDGAPFAAPLREVLAGPCLQNLVLSCGLVSLNFIDHCGTYGLEPCLQQNLPVAVLAPESWGVDGGQVQCAVRLPVATCSALRDLLPALELYDQPGSPLRRWYTGVGIALRVASVALASAAAWVRIEEEARAGAAAASSSSASSSAAAVAAVTAGAAAAVVPAQPRVQGLEPQIVDIPPWRRPQVYALLPKYSVVDISVRALRTASRIQNSPAAAAAAAADPAVRWDRWRMALATVEYALRWRGNADFDGLADLLVMAAPPRLENRGSPLPHTATPEVAAALDAGLLPCLERLLRRAASEPHGKEDKLAAEFLRVDENFLFGHLLLYGDRRQSAAAFATLRKVRRRHFVVGTSQHAAAAAAVGPKPPRLRDALVKTVVSAMSEGRAWLFDVVAKGGVICDASDIAVAAAGGAAAAGVNAAADGAATADAGGAATAEPQRRLGWLLTRFLHDWLGVLTKHMAAPYAHNAPQNDAATYAYRLQLQAFIWPCVSCVQLLAYSLRDGGMGSAVGGAVARQLPVDSWQRRVLADADVVELLGAALRLSEDEKWRQLLVGAQGGDADTSLCLADAMCRVAVAFPGEVREAAVAGAFTVEVVKRMRGATAGGGGGDRRSGGNIRSRRGAAAAGGGGGGAGGSADGAPAEDDVARVSYWPPRLVRSLAARVRAEHLECFAAPVAVALEALAAQLEVWIEGGAEDVAAGPLGAVMPLPEDPVVAAAAAALLAAPDEPAFSPLRTCANPSCVNLEGDSEAELGLAACGGCGAVGYCCRECQVAHWRAGHKAECKGMRVGAAAQSGSQ